MSAEIIPFPVRPGDVVRRFARQVEEAVLADQRDYLEVTTTPGLREDPLKLRQDICRKCEGDGVRKVREGGFKHKVTCTHCNGRGRV